MFDPFGGIHKPQSLFQLNDCDSGLAFAIPAQSEALDGLVPLEHLVNGLAQSAGTLAMDDGHGAQLGHDGAVDIVLHHALGLQGLQAPDIQLRGGPAAQATVLHVNDDGTLLLQAGKMKMTVKAQSVRLLETAQEVEQKKKVTPKPAAGTHVTLASRLEEQGAHHPRQGHRRLAQGRPRAPAPQ